MYWDGYNPTPSPAGYRATVSSYNGSSWTAQPTFPGSPAGYCGGAGTSSAGEGAGTASMGKWESGLTRGAANQLGVTKWSDSYQPSRGKGNPLW